MKSTEKIIIMGGILGLLIIFHKQIQPFLVPAALFGSMGGLIIFLVKDRDRLRVKYEEAKVALRKDPQNPLIREAFVIAGRRYYGAANGKGETTPNDEAAIQTDMLIILGDKK